MLSKNVFANVNKYQNCIFLLGNNFSDQDGVTLAKPIEVESNIFYKTVYDYVSLILWYIDLTLRLWFDD